MPEFMDRSRVFISVFVIFSCYFVPVVQGSCSRRPSPEQRLRQSGDLYFRSSKQNSSRDEPVIWPSARSVETNDRIVEQLFDFKAPVIRKKKILTVSGPSDIGSRFPDFRCPVKACTFTSRLSSVGRADAVVFFNDVTAPAGWQLYRTANQIWVWFNMDSPHLSPNYGHSHLINWTATYRRDSVLPVPYDKFLLFHNHTGLPKKNPIRNYAAGKTKMTAWVVSVCRAPNGRDEYMRELKKYVEVDVFGGCGEKRCPDADPEECFKTLDSTYKFYLAFEDSNCRDYITNTFYKHALRHNVIPVVMGAHPDDYQAVAPPHSYIHVDDFQSPKQLAEYLHKLDQNDDLYNAYFRWKGTGEFINTQFWCRLCNMVHAAESDGHRMSYKDLDFWSSAPGICLRPSKNEGWASWRGNKDRSPMNVLDTFSVYSEKKY